MLTDTSEGPIEAFWRNARRHAHMETVPVYFGSQAGELVVPPTWSFGANDEQADELLDLVLAGTKTATASAYADYEAEQAPLPALGDLSIVLDSTGRPRALLQTSAVEVRPFGEVDAEHARLEGEGDLSLDHWRRVHEAFFAAEGHEATAGMPVVLERFVLLYSAD